MYRCDTRPMGAIRNEPEQLVFLGQAGWPEAVIMAHVKELCNSKAFDDGEQSRHILEYLVAEALKGRLVSPRDIALSPMHRRIFGKGDDPLVRVAVGRLRKRMEEYYATLPKSHGLRLVIPEKAYLVLAPRNNSPHLSVDIPAIARIVTPEEGADVYRRIMVSGRIDSLDPDLRPWLIVLATDSFYYPQGRVSRRSPEWECEARIGRMQRGETDGVEFEILLAAAAVDGDFEFEAYMKRDGQGFGTRLPADVKILATRRVIRRDIRPGDPDYPPQNKR